MLDDVSVWAPWPSHGPTTLPQTFVASVRPVTATQMMPASSGTNTQPLNPQPETLACVPWGPGRPASANTRESIPPGGQ